MKKLIRNLAHRLGYDIVKLRNTDGIAPLHDMSRFLRRTEPVIFDVGANVGQSVRRFRSRFPDSTIHSFEPSPATFQHLTRNTDGIERLTLWNVALGARAGRLKFLENSRSDMSSFLPLSRYGWGEIERQTDVEVRTVDEVCRECGIEYLDILKSDTQGFDYEVFKGAEDMIGSGRIGQIYFEIIFSDMYKDLPSFGEIFEYLRRHDYLLASFYKIHYRRRLAAWTDALFVHKSIVD